MEDAQLWITPLILLPGGVLLTVSTSARSVELHSKVHPILKIQSEPTCCSLQNLLKRSKLRRDALVRLQLRVAVFSFASVLSCLANLWHRRSFGLRYRPHALEQ
ncbi:MAG: hypothetical protein L0Z68_08410 [Gammaproteobacteria bacterium]|nr:hypothetical protein [Gammaproteobacteria bacterium]